MYLMVLFLMKIRLCWQIVFQFEFFPLFAWEYDKIGMDCITFIWNSSLTMMCLIMCQSIVFVPWLVHDEHSLCISIINLMGSRGDSHSQYYIDAPAELLTVRYD